MQKLKSFRPWQPEQTTLLPTSPSDWLSADHQVYFPLDLVDDCVLRWEAYMNLSEAGI